MSRLTTSRGRLAAAALAALLLLSAACGGDDDGERADTTTTTAPDSTTTSTPASTTTTEATTTTVPLGDEPTFRDEGPSGSGCTPGSDVLPDGWWYGTVAVPVSGTVELDLACYYVGPAAEAEAASRGDEVNNDYYVVNDNPAVRSVPVAAGATAACVELESGLTTHPCEPAEVAGDWAIWIRVVGGEVDRIVEQYAP